MAAHYFCDMCNTEVTSHRGAPLFLALTNDENTTTWTVKFARNAAIPDLCDSCYEKLKACVLKTFKHIHKGEF